MNLAAADEVPNTRHPVGQQGEGGHEQGEDHGAVLRVAVQLLQEAQQPEEAHRLQQVDPEVLEERAATRQKYPEGIPHDIRPTGWGRLFIGNYPGPISHLEE